MPALVSVVIPAYNRAHTIADTIRSVQTQTYPFWEIIVADDGSTDDTCNVVNAIVQTDPRVHLIKQQKNQGAQCARNAAIKASRGEWIAFLDSDDQLLPDSIENRLSVAERDQVSVVHSPAYIVFPEKPQEFYHVPEWKGWVYQQMLSSAGTLFPSLLVKRSALEKIGYLDESIKAYQEWETSIRLAQFFAFGFEPRPTFIYDYRTNNAISRSHLLNALGYGQIVRKHSLAIIRYVGIAGLAAHHERIADWYQKAEKKASARWHFFLSVLLKVFSVRIYKNKIKGLFRKDEKR